MNFLWRLVKVHNHETVRWHQSRSYPEVRYSLRSISLGARLDLLARARELTVQTEYQRAGNNPDEITGAMNDLAVQRLYLTWGLVSLTGLRINGRTPSVAEFVEHGPDALCGEMLASIYDSLGLTEAETKN